MIEKTCLSCSTVFRVLPYRAETAKYCSRRCRAANAASWTSRPLLDRFWDKVERRDCSDCWPWTGATTFGGYGVIGLGRRRLLRAHRVSYEAHYGPIPDGAVVRHTCDNPSCVNPSHLLIGTQKDNMADKIERGRASRRKKLSDRAVQEIRASSDTVRRIANKYDISAGYVSMLKNSHRR